MTDRPSISINDYKSKPTFGARGQTEDSEIIPEKKSKIGPFNAHKRTSSLDQRQSTNSTNIIRVSTSKEKKIPKEGSIKANILKNFTAEGQTGNPRDRHVRSAFIRRVDNSTSIDANPDCPKGDSIMFATIHRRAASGLEKSNY
jgi:hypothetical protein